MLVNISDAFPLDTLISRPQILKNPHDIYPDTGGNPRQPLESRILEHQEGPFHQLLSIITRI